MGEITGILLFSANTSPTVSGSLTDQEIRTLYDHLHFNYRRPADAQAHQRLCCSHIGSMIVDEESDQISDI